MEFDSLSDRSLEGNLIFCKTMQGHRNDFSEKKISAPQNCSLVRSLGPGRLDENYSLAEGRHGPCMQIIHNAGSQLGPQNVGRKMLDENLFSYIKEL